MVGPISLLSLVLALFLSVGVASAEPWRPSAEETAILVERQKAEWTRLFGTGRLADHTPWSRLADFVLNGLAVGDRPERVTAALTELVDLQDTDPASPTWGNVRWFSGDRSIPDRNGAEFVTRHLTVAWLLYQDRLTEEQRRMFVRLFDLAKVGIERHAVRTAYTNIHLMKSWNLIALGQISSDRSLADLGRNHLRDWLERVERAGIEEYLSPDYYPTDLQSLALIENLATDPESTALARRGLDLVWRDVARHWYAPGGRLGGPYSRNYDRLHDRGGIDDFVARAGWEGRGRHLPGPFAAWAFAPPPPDAEALRATPMPRFVVSKVGKGVEDQISAYHGGDVYVGSAQTSYGLIDGPLLVHLGEGIDTPSIGAFMNGRGDPYGVAPVFERASGHMKVSHLRPFVTSMQKGPEVLFLMSSRGDAPDTSELVSDVVLPADAEISLDGRRLDVFRNPSQWTVDPPAAAAKLTSVEVVAAKDGHTEVHVSDNSGKAGLGLSRRLPVASGETVVLSADLSGGEVALYLNFYDAEDRRIGPENIRRVTPDGGTFRWFEYSVVAPPDAVSVKAWLYSTIAAETDLRIRALAVDVDQGVRDTRHRVADFDFVPPRRDVVAIPTGATLILRRGRGAVAIRPIAVWDTAGRAIAMKLVNDGLSIGAMRLTAVHAEERTGGRGTTALWVLAGDGLTDDATFAEFVRKATAIRTTATRDGNVVDLRSTGADGALRVSVDLAAKRCLDRAGAPTLPPGATVMVNGVVVDP